jgi:hypothetical protein
LRSTDDDQRHLLQDDYISSVGWLEDGYHLAVGTNHAQVQIWNSEKLKLVHAPAASPRLGCGRAARVPSSAYEVPWLLT